LFTGAAGSVNLFAQQYPFVHYSPKEGLISNMVKGIFQDSKGRLYFTSVNGLSVYDGSRFTNYNSRNGLGYDIVNWVREMGPDSFWIITNSPQINCLVNGLMKPLALAEPNSIVINKLEQAGNGKLYAASDQGLFYYDKNRFVRLPLTDIKGKDINSYVLNIIPVGNHLLIQRDYSLVREHQSELYLYNVQKQITVDQVEGILTYNLAKDGRIWVSTQKNIFSLDTIALKAGRLILNELPSVFFRIKNAGGNLIFFDNVNNVWLSDQLHALQKVSPDGRVITYTTLSGLSVPYINQIFQDKEGNIWIATNNAGVDKLVHSHVSFFENPFGLTAINDMNNSARNNQLLFYSSKDSKAILLNNDILVDSFSIKEGHEMSQIIQTPGGLYGTGKNKIFKLTRIAKKYTPQLLFTDSTDQEYYTHITDKNGNIIISGRHYITCIINPEDKRLDPTNEIIYREKITSFSDQAVNDKEGNIWIASRNPELIVYQTQPENTSRYLHVKYHFTKELEGLSSRSITIDLDGNIWLGTRNRGIRVFRLQNNQLLKLFDITDKEGLLDNFISHLSCDSTNNIWASSSSGLDKIHIKNGSPVVENFTRQNNIYQKVFKTVIDKNNTVWALMTSSVIKIKNEPKQKFPYTPSLFISMIKSGKDTLTGPVFTHRQNNLSFYFAATSYLNENQIQYNYRLHGGNQSLWPELAPTSTVSFIGLQPGSYVLEVKAIFPAHNYPEQILQYPFSITPPWWQTWWFRTIIGLLIIGSLLIGFRFYYNRKLEKKMAILEKQQAIEKERTRIATDMHDELGASLSRIKFLSENIKMNREEKDTMMNDIEKISAYSDDMAAKMGEIVWALNKKNDTVADLVAFTRSYVQEYLSVQNIQCELNTPLELPPTFIPGEKRQHIFLAVKECLHNIVKHSGASKVYFSVTLNKNIEIVVHDNGKGINLNSLRPFGNGIQNIQRRMAEIHGHVDFQNEKGTKVVLNIPFDV